MPVSFAPVIDSNTDRMVIGSMPGRASLDAGQYYAHPRNYFWKIAGDLFASSSLIENYHDRIALLLQNRTGLWDVLEYCEREGSLDSAIRHGKPNDFFKLFRKYPRVTRLFFNGQKACGTFIKHFGQIEGIAYFPLPSTSPANARMPYAEKLKIWSVLKTAP